jgi:hypothetical protein
MVLARSAGRDATGARCVRGNGRDEIMRYQTTIDLSQYLDEDNGQLKFKEVEQRIYELKGYREDAEDDGVNFDAELADELRLLNAFAGDVRREREYSVDLLVLVLEDHLEQFVRWEAEQVHGIGPDNVGDYVDWARYADDLRYQWSSMMLDGRTILVRNDS